MKGLLKTFTNLHRRSKDKPDIFIFSCPRSGTTLLLEMIATQPGFKPIKDPFDLRNEPVKAYMSRHGINDWSDYHTERAGPVMQEYLRKLQTGRLHSLDPYFYQNHDRLFTTRLVSKILHSAEERIGSLQEALGGRIIYLLRHPISVARSRKQLPRLDSLLHSEISEHLSSEQLEFALATVESGTDMQRSMVDWCIQNAIPLAAHHDDWIYVSYEQLVTQPEVVVEHLCRELALPDPAAMLARQSVPSVSTRTSDEVTRQTIRSLGSDKTPEQAEAHKEWLIYGKWRDKVNDQQEDEMMSVLDGFGVDFYSRGSARPHPRYWLGA